MYIGVRLTRRCRDVPFVLRTCSPLFRVTSFDLRGGQSLPNSEAAFHQSRLIDDGLLGNSKVLGHYESRMPCAPKRAGINGNFSVERKSMPKPPRVFFGLKLASLRQRRVEVPLPSALYVPVSFAMAKQADNSVRIHTRISLSAVCPKDQFFFASSMQSCHWRSRSELALRPHSGHRYVERRLSAVRD